MCQLDWTMECTDIWWNMILNVSVKAFFNEINIWICTLRQTVLLMCGSHPISGRPEYDKTPDLLSNKRELCLPDWAETLVFSPFGLRLKHHLFLSLKPTSFPARTYTVCFPGPPACWLQILRFFRLHNNETIAYNKYLSIYIRTHTYTY